jgi:hypothetical protein
VQIDGFTHGIGQMRKDATAKAAGRLPVVQCLAQLTGLGMPWLHNLKSGFLFGIGEDAAYPPAPYGTRKGIYAHDACVHLRA